MTLHAITINAYKLFIFYSKAEGKSITQKSPDVVDDHPAYLLNMLKKPYFTSQVILISFSTDKNSLSPVTSPALRSFASAAAKQSA